MGANPTYSDTQITEFLELAQEIGITRAKRDLGYPKSWDTASKWAKNRGIDVAADELKSRAAAARVRYHDDEMRMGAQEGLDRIIEDWTTKAELTADEQKKYAEAYKVAVNIILTLDGKATNINETRDSSTSVENADLYDMLTAEKARREIARKNSLEESFSLVNN